ncbi:cutinase [Paraphoma chrysanthemicola]|uniref:Cutinase n=1 Tax=Paraphoma chrysanthemicola TaxID=798071 RepID=A0A8K0W378_9PLEO|nr:cutinase [Paraphoma chrysanthemicola]
MTRSASLLFGILAVQRIALVHGLPASADRFQLVGREDLSPDNFDLAPRQDIPDALAGFPSGPLNQLLRLFSTLPQGAVALDAVGKIITPLTQVLADSKGIETTRNDLANGAPCAAVTVVFARGTTEPGNVGLFAGPPFFDALSEQLEDSSLAVQGVEYPATFASFNQNGTAGVPSMTKFINQALTSCPNTKLVMSGYSQGALVVRSTAASLPAATMAKVNSVVTFGDPGNPGPITGAQDKTLIICHENDAVCQGGFITVDHLTYADDASTAAAFVLQKAGIDSE